MVQTGAEMEGTLKEANRKRKAQEITAAEYYKELMSLLVELAQSIQAEEVNEDQIKSQIPLLKVFLTEQVQKMINRGN